MTVRELGVEAAADLGAGADHYRAYVGPPEHYDLIGSSQFALLHHLGLRDTHRVLDFGCGSLRLGRMLIPFLRRGGYFGVEPNAWLVDEGLDRELGRDAQRLKALRFDHNADFECDVFDGARFDFIVAQSIFTHTGRAASLKLLRSFAQVLAPGGLAVINWRTALADDPAAQAQTWVYPGLVDYAEPTLASLYAEAELAFRPTPWPHPAALRWDVAALNETALPTPADLAPLSTPPLTR